MRILLPLLVVLSLLTSSCKKESDQQAPITVQAQILGTTWLESYEEEQPGSPAKVFRPASYPFPAARTRFGFQFDAGNVFTTFGPSPEDGLLNVPGRWRTTAPDQFSISPINQTSSFTLRLLSLQNQVLRVLVLP